MKVFLLVWMLVNGRIEVGQMAGWFSSYEECSYVAAHIRSRVPEVVLVECVEEL